MNTILSHGVTEDFMEYFGITRIPAAMLTLLYRTKGSGVPMQRLLSTSSCRSAASARVQICGLRQAMETEAIDYDDGLYSLTEIGRSECAKALAECERVRAA